MNFIKLSCFAILKPKIGISASVLAAVTAARLLLLPHLNPISLQYTAAQWKCLYIYPFLLSHFQNKSVF